MSEHDTPVPGGMTETVEDETDTRPLPIHVDTEDDEPDIRGTDEWEVEPHSLIEEGIPEGPEREEWWGYYEPAARLKLAIEIAAIFLLAVLVLSLAFLVALGGYSLVQIAP